MKVFQWLRIYEFSIPVSCWKIQYAFDNHDSPQGYITRFKYTTAGKDGTYPEVKVLRHVSPARVSKEVRPEMVSSAVLGLRFPLSSLYILDK